MTRLSPLPVSPRVDAACYPVVHASATRLVTEWNTLDDDAVEVGWVRDPVIPTRAWLREWEGELCNFTAGQLPGGYLACDADDWDDWPPTFAPILRLTPILGDRLAGLNPVVVVDPVWYLAIGQTPASPPPRVDPAARQALAKAVAKVYWATMSWATEEARTLFPARTHPARPQEDHLADLLAWWIECLGDIPGSNPDRRYDEAVNDLDPYGVWQPTSHPHYPAFGITIPARRLYQVGWQRLTSLYPGPHPTLDAILTRIATSTTQGDD